MWVYVGVNEAIQSSGCSGVSVARNGHPQRSANANANANAIGKWQLVLQAVTR
jgi:hypothetical protein